MILGKVKILKRGEASLMERNRWYLRKTRTRKSWRPPPRIWWFLLFHFSLYKIFVPLLQYKAVLHLLIPTLLGCLHYAEGREHFSGTLFRASSASAAGTMLGLGLETTKVLKRFLDLIGGLTLAGTVEFVI
ncbi:Uncharacterized protein Adt_10853 [Abeliophyllum distichum]|uniref:Uncharacterized protein n=1 Tax=Abeliophyllum distichum TaxID=126358 RepID=A0ABD1UL79_9LAMI